uniref:Insulin-induced gene protein n=1 Tax=Gasterosteus aculeatus TaxID=69293 RepID=G3N9F8_GASAC
MSDSAVIRGQPKMPRPNWGPYISVITNRTTNLVIRGAMLFSVGVFLALVLNLLQADCLYRCQSINHASAKVDFANNVQLSLTLAALSVGLWWTFDRSRSGFGLGVSIALLATLATQLLVYNGVFQYTSPDFLYIRSWLPCIFFAGVITMGNIGRQLALYEGKFCQEKTHQD